jgi:hypothetical protein
LAQLSLVDLFILLTQTAQRAQLHSGQNWPNPPGAAQLAHDLRSSPTSGPCHCVPFASTTATVQASGRLSRRKMSHHDIPTSSPPSTGVAPSSPPPKPKSLMGTHRQRLEAPLPTTAHLPPPLPYKKEPGTVAILRHNSCRPHFLLLPTPNALPPSKTCRHRLAPPPADAIASRRPMSTKKDSPSPALPSASTTASSRAPEWTHGTTPVERCHGSAACPWWTVRNPQSLRCTVHGPNPLTFHLQKQIIYPVKSQHSYKYPRPFGKFHFSP